jgi:hypothetical protein
MPRFAPTTARNGTHDKRSLIMHGVAVINLYARSINAKSVDFLVKC